MNRNSDSCLHAIISYACQLLNAGSVAKPSAPTSQLREIEIVRGFMGLAGVDNRFLTFITGATPPGSEARGREPIPK
jgi:hypothetical protein